MVIRVVKCVKWWMLVIIWYRKLMFLFGFRDVVYICEWDEGIQIDIGVSKLDIKNVRGEVIIKIFNIEFSYEILYNFQSNFYSFRLENLKFFRLVYD